MPNVGCAGSKSSMCGTHVRAADEGHISWLIKPRGLEEPLTASLLLFLVVLGRFELCASCWAQWCWSRVNRLQMGSDGACGEGDCSIFLAGFYCCSSKSVCCFTIDATMFRWVQYGRSDQGPNSWGKLKENTFNCENCVVSLLLLSNDPALFT